MNRVYNTAVVTGSERTRRDGPTARPGRHETARDLRPPAIVRRDVAVVRESSRRRALSVVQQGPTYDDAHSDSDVGGPAVRRCRQRPAGRYLSQSRLLSGAFRRLLQVPRIPDESYRTGKILADRVERRPLRRFKTRVHWR